MVADVRLPSLFRPRQRPVELWREIRDHRDVARLYVQVLWT